MREWTQVLFYKESHRNGALVGGGYGTKWWILMGPFYFHLFGFILFVLMRGINITAHLYARMNDTVETRKLIIGGSRGPVLCSG